MIAKNNLNYKFVYRLEKIKKSYKQYALESSEADILMTEKVRIEPVRVKRRFPGANEVLKIRNRPNWDHCTRSGLRPFYHKYFYYGDYLIEGEKALFIVKVDRDKLTLRLFPGFYTNDKQVLEQITDSIVQKLLKL